MHFYKSLLKLLNALLATIMLSLTSCAPMMDNIETNATTNTSPQTATAIPNTSTPLPIPSPTLSSTPTIRIEDRCLTLEESLPNNFQFEGVWVRQESKPYLENLVENTKYRVPLDGGGRLGNYWMDLSISPNGEWLAYLDSILDTSGRTTRMEGLSLKIIHSSGYFLSMDYWPVSMQSIQGWVDDKNLLLKLGQRFIVLNPFSGKWYEIRDPDWLSNLTVDEPWWNETKRYSPHLDAVTVRLDNHSELRSTISEDKLFGGVLLGFFEKISWSPDGTMLAVVTNHGLNIFHNNIIISELSFGKFISQLDNLVWSQNNKKLLIDTYSNLSILNVENSSIQNLCFIDKDIHKTYKDSFFYLPTGNYVVAPVYKSNKRYDYEYFDVLIDTEAMRAYKLPTSEYNGRIGWLALPDSTEK